jgi:hypothetical protein
MRWAIAFLREPILHFLVLGALFYGAVSIHARLTDPHTIVVTDATVEQISQRYIAQFGSPPSPDQFANLVDRYIHEEALYRQAIAQGLVENDELVRRRIVQKMEFLEEGEAEIGEPTDDDLRAFYQQNAARYVRPARVTFTQIYFSPDNGGDAGARERATAALQSLKAQPEQPIAGLGDPDPVKQNFALVTGADVEHAFGQGDLVSGLFDAPIGQWSGPLRSGFGWHLVRVEAREPQHPPVMAEIDDDLRADWREAQQAKYKQQALDALMRDYTVVRKDKTAMAAK